MITGSAFVFSIHASIAISRTMVTREAEPILHGRSCSCLRDGVKEVVRMCGYWVMGMITAVDGRPGYDITCYRECPSLGFCGIGGQVGTASAAEDTPYRL